MTRVNTAAANPFWFDGAVSSGAAAGTQTLSFSNGACRIAGVLSDGTTGGRIALAKTGTNDLRLDATNTFTGDIWISGGRIIGSPQVDRFGPSKRTVFFNNGTLRLQDFTAAQTIDLALDLTAGSGHVQVQGTKLVSFPNRLVGNGDFIKSGAANIQFTVAALGRSGANTYIEGGPVNLRNVDALGTGANLYIGHTTTAGAEFQTGGGASVTFSFNIVEAGISNTGGRLYIGSEFGTPTITFNAAELRLTKGDIQLGRNNIDDGYNVRTANGTQLIVTHLRPTAMVIVR